MIVYLVTNLKNGKRYVGKTKRDLERRWYEHVYHTHGGSDEMALYRAIRKHGAESFEKTVLEECTSEEELDVAEKKWIRELGTFQHEYNMTEGGDGLKGYKHTEATKAKMSESRKGAKNHNYGKKWGRSGPLKEITKQRISEAKKDVPVHSEVYKRRVAEQQYVKVVQYDLYGNPLATYLSLKDAQMITGIKFQGISRACRSPIRTAGGFKWRYADQNQKA